MRTNKCKNFLVKENETYAKETHKRKNLYQLCKKKLMYPCIMKTILEQVTKITNLL